MATDVTTPRERAAGSNIYESPPRWRALASVSHKSVAKRFVVTGFVFFVLGGIEALLLRVQLMQPEFDFLSADQYNQIFTLHGSTMMFLFAVPVIEGMANYLIPLQIGARDLPFPRFNAFNYWAYLLAGTLIYSSILFDAVPDAGWFAYTPLSGPVYSSGIRMDFWLTGVTLAEISAIGAAVEFIASILKTRAPGMSLNRMPILAWSMLVTSVMLVMAFTPLVVGSLLLESDRLFGTTFFDDELGGSQLLWQHFFWIFGHPEVYVMFLPAAGMVSHIVQTFSGRPLVGYTFVVAAILAVGFLSMGLWVHHMFTVGLSDAAIGFFSAASLTIAIPNGIQVFAWVATLWSGRPRFQAPLLFSIAFMLIFVIGGITGVMVAVAPFDWQAHDTYFLVAHFHYVLIGGVVFPLMGAVYYWFPKVTGRMMSDRVGMVSCALAFVGFNVTFFPMHWTGLLGMPRRVYTYLEGTGWEGLNLWSSLGAFVLATGFALTLLNAIASYRNGEPAGANPWGADTLEWSIPSPAPAENFARQPVVTSRHPLWTLPEGEPAARPVDAQAEEESPSGVAGDVDASEAVAVVPARWRNTLGTGLLDARPLEVVHLSRPTFVPIVPAVGLAVLGIAAITKSLLVALVGLVLLLGGVVAWVVVNERERSEAVEDVPEAAPVRLNVSGPGGVGWWGLVLSLLILGVVLSSVVFSYYYLSFQNESWPPLLQDGYPPPVLLPTVAVVLVLLSLVPLHLARRRSREDPSADIGGTVAIALLLGFLAVLLDLLTWTVLVDFGPRTDAYTSAFFAVAVSVLAVAVLALAGVVLLAVATRVRRLHPRRDYLLRNFLSLWYFFVIVSVVAYLVLHLIPEVTS